MTNNSPSRIPPFLLAIALILSVANSVAIWTDVFISDCISFVKNNAENSTQFVVSPEKMGIIYWSLRENVVFGPEYRGIEHYVAGRGFEFRWDNTPDKPHDANQEIHTTLSIYDSADYVAGIVFEGEVIEQNGMLLYLERGVGDDDPWRLSFSFGRIEGNIKSKYVKPDSAARELLLSAAQIIIPELLTTCEAQ